MGELSAMLAKWKGKEVVLVNPGWTTESAPSSHAALARSFEVVYCFQPIAIQVMPVMTIGHPAPLHVLPEAMVRSQRCKGRVAACRHLCSQHKAPYCGEPPGRSP